MKIKIKVGELVEQISQAAITIDPKSVEQPNSKVYLRAARPKDATDNMGVLYYYSTNQLAKTFIKSTGVEVIEPGELLVSPGKLLGGLQGRDPELLAQIEVEQDATKQDDPKSGAKTIVVRIGRNKFKLSYSIGADKLSTEIEKLPFKTPAMATIPSSLLNNFIKRTAFCIPAASNGQARFAMDVMHLKATDSTYHAQATDGVAISMNRGPKNEQLSFAIDSLLIPQEALGPLQRLVQKHKDDDVELINAETTQSVRELFFRMPGSVLFGCRLRTGKAPQLDLVVEQNRSRFEVTVDREELKGAIVRASNFIGDGPRHILLEFTEGNQVKIRAGQAAENIKDEAAFEVTQGNFAPVQIAVTLDYLANIVGALTSPKIILGLPPDKVKAIMVRSDDKDENDQLVVGSTYAVSPVKMAAFAKHE